MSNFAQAVYGVGLTIPIKLYDPDGVNINTSATFEAGDVVVTIDGGTPTNITTLPSFVGNNLNVVLSNSEVTGKEIAVDIVDQTATKVWLDTGFAVQTIGTSSAELTVPLGTDITSEADLVDAVWDEALSGHTTAGTTGQAVTDILTDTETTLPNLLATIDTVVDAILVDTGTDIPALISALNNFDPATETVDVGAYLGTALTETSAGYLANALSFFYDVASATKTVNDVGVAGAGLTAADVWAYSTRGLTDKAGFTISGTKQTLDALNDIAVGDLNNFDPATDVVAHVTLVDTTTTNTDMRGTDNAATEVKQDIIDANVDAILEDTSTTIPAVLATLSTFDPTTDEVETGESYQQMISDIRAGLRGNTDTSGTKFYRADGTTEAFTVAIASGNRTFTDPA